jgi:uncharacterized membrane protein
MESSTDIHPPSRAKSFFAHGQIQHTLDAIHASFPSFKHEQHDPIVNVNEVVDEKLTMGQRIADNVASTVGSWRFIIVQSSMLAFWIILNCIAWISHWDPYPFILLNLALSFQAAYTGPFVMMSQNRQAVKDRLTAENDYKTDVKGEQEICHIMDHLDHQDNMILQIVQGLQAQTHSIEQEEKQILLIVEQLQQQSQLIERQEKLILQIVERAEVQHQQFMEQRKELLEKISQITSADTKVALHNTSTNGESS